MIFRSQLGPALVLCCLIFLALADSAATQANDSQKPSFTIQANVNRVLVPVVVRDKQGRPVDGLKKEEFQVFDNDKPRLVSAFTMEKRGAAEDNTASNTPGVASPSATADAVPQPPSLPRRILVFLFDDMHLSYEDLAYVKKAGVKALEAALTGSDMAAVVSLSGKTNSGLTRDHAKLQDAIMNLQLRGVNRSEKSDCPYIEYYQADLMLNKHDNAATADAVQQVLICDPGIDPQRDYLVAQRLADSAARRSLTIGYQDVQASFATLAEIVHRMAALPGERTLVLVSPGFLSIEPDAVYAESQIIDFAAQSNVTVSALDARGLYTTSMTASDDLHANGLGVARRSEFRASSMKAAENVMAELADGTGGTFFHNNNDLDAGFKTLTEAPKVIYLLELPLDDVKQDGSYHRLKVKVDREGLQLQARRGYFVPKAEKPKK